MTSKNRREFINETIQLSLGLACTPWPIRQDQDRYQNLRSGKFLSKIRVETEITEDKIFTEGPAVDKNGNVYFTNIPTQRILKWEPDQRALSIFDAESQAANGLRFAPDGALIVCQGATGRVVRINIQTGAQEILADAYQGKKIQAPNDLDIDAKGRIYFSSRMNDADLSTYNEIGVYRIDAPGQVVQLLKAPEIDMPNGIVVSPDQKTLYIIEAHPASEKNRKILAFDLDGDGNIANQRTLYNFYPGRSGDGMCIDAKGYLYVAAGLHQTRNTSETLDTKPGIHVISPQGKLVAYRETPVDTITNCTFGGKDLRDLYITCGPYLLKARSKTPGKASY